MREKKPYFYIKKEIIFTLRVFIYIDVGVLANISLHSRARTPSELNLRLFLSSYSHPKYFIVYF